MEMISLMVPKVYLSARKNSTMHDTAAVASNPAARANAGSTPPE